MIAATIIEWIYTQQAVVITYNRNHVSEVLAVTAAQTVIFPYLVGAPKAPLYCFQK